MTQSIEVVEVLTESNSVFTLESNTVVVSIETETEVVETSGSIVIQGTPGPAGGVSAEKFEFTTPAMTWTANHSFNYKPTVTVTNLAGQVIEADISYPSSNLVMISFSKLMAGELELK